MLAALPLRDGVTTDAEPQAKLSLAEPGRDTAATDVESDQLAQIRHGVGRDFPSHALPTIVPA